MLGTMASCLVDELEYEPDYYYNLLGISITVGILASLTRRCSITAAIAAHACSLVCQASFEEIRSAYLRLARVSKRWFTSSGCGVIFTR